MTTGQYIRRAAGYFFKLIVLIILLYLILFATGMSNVSVKFFFTEMFSTYRGPLLIVALAALSAFYPRFGFVSRHVDADILTDRDRIINAFHAQGYALQHEEEGRLMTFRASSVFRKLWMTFDDKVTVTADGEGIIIEGIRKSAVQAEFRINTYVQNKRYEE